MNKRFAFIDALRGLAALSVVLFHAVEGKHIGSLPDWLRVVIGHGDLGVAVFFVLSGFVIAHSLQDQEMTAGNVGRFMLRRSIRLDPPYWIAIAIAISFSLLASAIVKGRPSDQFSTAQVLSHLLYLQDFLGYKNINTVFWTLCYEIQFYLVFAVMLTARSWKLLAAAFAVSLLWPLGIAPGIRGLFSNLWFGFLLGVGAYYAWIRRDALPWFIAYAAVILMAGAWFSNPFALACSSIALIILVTARTGQIGSLNWRWLQFLGVVSYSLYLIHNPITGATFRLGYMITGRTPATEWLWWLVSIGASVTAAYVLHLLVERPAMRLSRKIGNSPSYGADGAVAPDCAPPDPAMLYRSPSFPRR